MLNVLHVLCHSSHKNERDWYHFYPHVTEERMRFRKLKSHSYRASLDSLNHYATCAPKQGHEQYVTYILMMENYIAFKKYDHPRGVSVAWGECLLYC